VLRDLADGGSAFAGVAVYVWHCDRDGGCSMYSDGIQQENYLRGVQVAGADGTVRFTSVFPACYTGRWPHLTSDNVFGEDGGKGQLPTVTGDAENGYTVSLVVGVDTHTTPAAGGGAPGGPPPGR
jgi:hypothetical protein